MKVLSLKPVWAWAVMHAGKTVENRSWVTAYRGPLLIHASGSIGSYADDAPACEAIAPGITVPEYLECGAIIGRVDLVDVCAAGEPLPSAQHRRWAQRDLHHFIFSNPRPCKPVDVLGKLRLWEYDESKLMWL